MSRSLRLPRWSIRRRPLALVSPGARPVTIPVKEIGRGNFSACLRGTTGFMRDTVFLITYGAAKEKDVMAKLANQSPHIPGVSKVGRIYAGGEKFTLYQCPFYRQGLSRANRRIRSTLQECVAKLDKDERYYEKPGKVIWPDAARPLMEALRECAEEGRVPPGVLYALDLILSKTKRGMWFLEFQDNNLAQDSQGNLILLDVLGTVDVHPPARDEDDMLFVEGL